MRLRGGSVSHRCGEAQRRGVRVREHHDDAPPDQERQSRGSRVHEGALRDCLLYTSDAADDM
eukprot:15446512-Alexandrium_andersonii.AAC.1